MDESHLSNSRTHISSITSTAPEHIHDECGSASRQEQEEFYGNFLIGEEVLEEPRVLVCKCHMPVLNTTIPGRLFFTNFKLIFKMTNVHSFNQERKRKQFVELMESVLKLPYATIFRAFSFNFDSQVSSLSSMVVASSSSIFGVDVETKDLRRLRFVFETSDDRILFLNLLDQRAFYGQDKLGSSAFAFKHGNELKKVSSTDNQSMKNQQEWMNTLDSLSLSSSSLLISTPLESYVLNSWIYDSHLEYQRLCHRWSEFSDRFSLVNQTSAYSFCPTYPQYLIMPASVSHTCIQNAARFRGSGRLPAVVWISEKGGALVRCAQPKTGGLGSRNQDDELLVKSIWMENPTYAVEKCINGSNSNSDRSNSPSIARNTNYNAKDSLLPTSSSPDSLATSPAKSTTPPPFILTSPSESPISNLNEHPIMDKDANDGKSSPDTFSKLAQHKLSPAAATAILENPQIQLQAMSIVDARSQLAAQANMVHGGGYEAVQYYGNTSITFACIENIHAVRSSFLSLASACCSGPSPPSHDQIESTRWLSYVRDILSAASSVVEKLKAGQSVLVHCSDGWDRTSQLTSLSQIIMDPYFRTAHGFCQLVQKEWTSFGHKFKKRLGIGLKLSDSSEISPVFVQWVDCVWQLMNQCPTKFEFTEQFLIELIDAMHSGQYGNFMADCEREYNEQCLFNTPSYWIDIKTRWNEEGGNLKNGLFEETDLSRYCKKKNSTENIGVDGSDVCNNDTNGNHTSLNRMITDPLLFEISPSKITFWQSFYYRYNITVFRLLQKRDSTSPLKANNQRSYFNEFDQASLSTSSSSTSSSSSSITNNNIIHNNHTHDDEEAIIHQIHEYLMNLENGKEESVLWRSLAAQAAVSATNGPLIQDILDLWETIQSKTQQFDLHFQIKDGAICRVTTIIQPTTINTVASMNDLNNQQQQRKSPVLKSNQVESSNDQSKIESDDANLSAGPLPTNGTNNINSHTNNNNFGRPSSAPPPTTQASTSSPTSSSSSIIIPVDVIVMKVNGTIDDEGNYHLSSNIVSPNYALMLKGLSEWGTYFWNAASNLFGKVWNSYR